MALISWRNAADTATLTLTGGATAAAEFPLTNLQKRGLASSFKTSAAVSGCYISADNTAFATEVVDGLFSSRGMVYPAITPDSSHLQDDGKIILAGSGGIVRLNSDGTVDGSV